MVSRHLERFKLNNIIAPLLVLMATFFIRSFYLEQVNRENDQRFHFAASQFSHDLENRLRLYDEALNGLQGLFAASERVTRKEFNNYVSSLQLNQRYPGFKALSFNRHITHAQKASFESTVRQDISLEASGYPGFVVTPAGERKEYIVVEYIEPKSGNEEAFGFDIYSNSARRHALEYTRDTGLTTATGPISLVQDPSKQSGFLLLKPLYLASQTPSTRSQRRQDFLGVVVAVFQINKLLREVLSEHELAQFTLKIYDHGSSIDQHEPGVLTKIFDSNIITPVNNEQGSAKNHQLALNVAGRIWQLSFHPLIMPSANSSASLSALITGGGVAFSLLLYGTLYFASARERAVKNVRRLAIDLLSHQEDLDIAKTVFANSTEGLIITDAQLNILAVNKAFTDITGFSASEALNNTPRMLKSGKQTTAFYKKMWQALKKNNQWQGELWNHRKDGTLYAQWLTISTYRNSEGNTIRYIGIFRDITEEKSTQDHIKHLAYFDALTDLANRSLLEDRINIAMHRAKRDGSNLAILFIDLDRFKTINDSLGHHLGDKLLQQVSKRLKACVRESDTVARLGGDEFIILLTEFCGLERITTVMSRISACFAETFHLEEHLFHMSASIGISLYPKDGLESDALFMHADTAMYQAKDAGGNNYQFFNAQMNQLSIERLAVEQQLRDALENQQLSLYFQPQVDIKTQKIIGLEALIRWFHPVRGMISPDDFIPIAEESDLILAIGDWVLKEACHQGKLLQAMGIDQIKIAVNLSARQFGQNYDLVKRVQSALQDSAFSAQWLELEITETVLMQYQDTSIDILNSLHDMGISLSLDDFGTGYSSLSYLRYFSVDTIKIDRSFISSVTDNIESNIIVSAIIKLAHNLKLKVIAEGVETTAQLAYLQKQGCDVFQGYLCSKPVPVGQLANLFQPGTEDENLSGYYKTSQAK